MLVYQGVLVEFNKGRQQYLVNGYIFDGFIHRAQVFQCTVCGGGRIFTPDCKRLDMPIGMMVALECATGTVVKTKWYY